MDWLTYYERNRENRMPVPWERGIHVDQGLRGPLVESLRRFQVGESGEGEHLKKQAKTVKDADYERIIHLFIDEEKEHARLLERLVVGMGGEVMAWHWSDAVFVAVRRLMGLKLELSVLLSAEMIAKRYYRMLYEVSQDPVLRAVFAQILRDEVGHVAFHCDFLHEQLIDQPLPVRLLKCVVWWLFFRMICLVVAVDHGAVLKASGISTREFLRECGHIFDQVAGHIFFRRSARPAPVRLQESPDVA